MEASDLVEPGIGAKRSINARRIAIPAIAAIVVFIVIVSFAYLLLVWHIYESMYSAKFGSFDWFNTIFYHGYAFIVPAIIAFVVIFPFPGRSDLFSMLREANSSYAKNRYRYGGAYDAGEREGVVPREIQVKSRNLWIIWQAVKWLVAFGIAYSAQGFFFYPNATEAVMLDVYGFGSWSQIPQIIALPFDLPSSQQILTLLPTMQAQYYILDVAIGSVLVIIAIRLFLKAVRDLLTHSGNRWIIEFMGLGLVICLGIWLGAPFWLMNVTTPYTYALLLLFIASFAFGMAYFRLSGKGLVPITSRKRAITKIIALIIVILFIFNIGTLAYLGINWNNNWLQYSWTPQIQNQISVTQWSSGLDNVNTSFVSSIPTGNISQILSIVRQWDDNASLIRSQAQIGVNYLAIANSEIVYLNNQQYWIQPTTIAYPPGSTDWISEHLIYTHADRIIVLNGHTGSYVSLTQALGIPSNSALDNPLIYYGERGGFYNNVYVNVQNEPPQIGGVSYSWSPDYVLSGAERGLWFFAHGPATWGFAFSPPQDKIAMLFNRDIYTRVASTLVSGLVVDPQTYLVTDGTNLYYAVMVYIDYPLLTGFAQSDYLRNFGVVLVNVNDGSMQPYLVDNSTGFISSFFQKYYPSWDTQAPAWLQKQIRYPEQLLGTQTQPGQFDIDFLYHVNSPSVWRSGSDFYERPNNTPVYYILVNEGNQLYYVGLQLAEFQLSLGHNLGGIYLAYGGTRLNQLSLYRVNSLSNSTNRIIGPQAALQALDTNPQVREQLTLLTNPAQGNVLPYLINGQLYYFIPVYVNTGSSQSAVITKLAFMGIVDASNGVSTYGQTSLDAYTTLLSSETNGSAVPSPISIGGPLSAENVASAFNSSGYNVLKPVFVNVNVGFATATISLGNTTSQQLNSTVSSFITRYAVPNNVHTIYEWRSVNSTNFGIITNDNGTSVAYYIVVTT